MAVLCVINFSRTAYGAADILQVRHSDMSVMLSWRDSLHTSCTCIIAAVGVFCLFGPVLINECMLPRWVLLAEVMSAAVAYAAVQNVVA